MTGLLADVNVLGVKLWPPQMPVGATVRHHVPLTGRTCVRPRLTAKDRGVRGVYLRNAADMHLELPR